ncbi:MAG TPA: hypothetical protein VHK27_05485 [Gammaproteobacteria bacterium]|nr:hypothetical protein [Gammaproteobacteria bacterium]
MEIRKVKCVKRVSRVRIATGSLVGTGLGFRGMDGGILQPSIMMKTEAGENYHIDFTQEEMKRVVDYFSKELNKCPTK